jgi:glycosyltransferase involved in cell wall biosynthesis
VIAFRGGSVPEIVEDGATGFVVDGETGVVDAVRRLSTLDRACVRARFERRFTARRMAGQHLDLFETSMRRCRGTFGRAATGP